MAKKRKSVIKAVSSDEIADDYVDNELENVEDIPNEIEVEIKTLSVSDQSEEAKKARLDMAKEGLIQDARVFHLMYLEKCAVEASLQIEVRKTAYETRIQTLRQELSTVVRQWEAQQKRAIRKIADIRSELEDGYGIHIAHWGYDEDTGVLRKLPQEVVDPDDSASDRGSGA